MGWFVPLHPAAVSLSAQARAGCVWSPTTPACAIPPWPSVLRVRWSLYADDTLGAVGARSCRWLFADTLAGTEPRWHLWRARRGLYAEHVAPPCSASPSSVNTSPADSRPAQSTLNWPGIVLRGSLRPPLVVKQHVGRGPTALVATKGGARAPVSFLYHLLHPPRAVVILNRTS